MSKEFFVGLIKNHYILKKSTKLLYSNSFFIDMILIKMNKILLTVEFSEIYKILEKYIIYLKY